MRITHNRCYKAERKKAYPDVGDQLDAIYKLALTLQSQVELPEEVISWISSINSIKEKYPKNPGSLNDPGN